MSTLPSWPHKVTKLYYWDIEGTAEAVRLALTHAAILEEVMDYRTYCWAIAKTYCWAIAISR